MNGDGMGWPPIMGVLIAVHPCSSLVPRSCPAPKAALFPGHGTSPDNSFVAWLSMAGGSVLLGARRTGRPLRWPGGGEDQLAGGTHDKRVHHVGHQPAVDGLAMHGLHAGLLGQFLVVGHGPEPRPEILFEGIGGRP